MYGRKLLRFRILSSIGTRYIHDTHILRQNSRSQRDIRLRSDENIYFVINWSNPIRPQCRILISKTWNVMQISILLLQCQVEIDLFWVDSFGCRQNAKVHLPKKGNHQLTGNVNSLTWIIKNNFFQSRSQFIIFLYIHSKFCYNSLIQWHNFLLF